MVAWPVAASDELKSYVARKLELTLQDDCIVGNTSGNTKEIASIYSGGTTQGSCCIKALAQSYVW